MALLFCKHPMNDGYLASRVPESIGVRLEDLFAAGHPLGICALTARLRHLIQLIPTLARAPVPFLLPWEFMKSNFSCKACETKARTSHGRRRALWGWAGRGKLGRSETRRGGAGRGKAGMGGPGRSRAGAVRPGHDLSFQLSERYANILDDYHGYAIIVSTYHGWFGAGQRTAGRRGGAGPGRMGRRRFGSPSRQLPLLPPRASRAPKTTVLNDSPEARTSETPANRLVESKTRIYHGRCGALRGGGGAERGQA